MIGNIALYCGIPPTCERCAEDDAKAVVKTKFGQLSFCECCLIDVINLGLAAKEDSKG